MTLCTKERPLQETSVLILEDEAYFGHCRNDLLELFIGEVLEVHAFDFGCEGRMKFIGGNSLKLWFIGVAAHSNPRLEYCGEQCLSEYGHLRQSCVFRLQSICPVDDMLATDHTGKCLKIRYDVR